jgi:hypothetical protein
LVSSIIRIYLFSLFLQAWSDFPQLIQQFCRMFTVDGEYVFNLAATLSLAPLKPVTVEIYGDNPEQYPEGGVSD